MAKQLDHKPDHFQQMAIDSTSRGIRIVAPAGSGKSETLARRVAKRIDQDGIDPKRILVLTFDNAAKKSLNSFFSQLLNSRQMPQIRSLNQHGNAILKSYFPEEQGQLIGNIPVSEVQLMNRRYNDIGRDLSALTWDGVPRTLVETFGALKEQGFYPKREGEYERQIQWLRDEYLRLPREGESATLDEMWSMPSAISADDTYGAQLRTMLEQFDQHESEMRKNGLMDFVDQKSRAANRLWRSSANLERLRSEFDEIVVDECQDISRLDAMLAYYTAGPSTLVVLAGDDDQTLYEWRNAHSLYLRKPELVFKDIDFETIHLDLNYRSPQQILGPAVQLISHNVERIEKRPTGYRDDGTLIVQPTQSTRMLEQLLIADIREEIENGRDPLDIVVLCHDRNERDQKVPIEQLLRSARIPVVEVDRNEQPVNNKAGIWVRTFQKAKGRQWPVVYIPSANDRDVPDNDSIRKGEIEAIRRRFYVAMTRASEKLVISYVRGGDIDRIDRTGDDEVVGTNGASRFLFEAGLVSEPDAESPRPSVTRDSTSESFVSSPKPNFSKPTAPANAPTNPVENVTPKVPVPAQEPARPKRKGKLKDWEPRAPDTARMDKARREWESRDFDDAIRNAWKPLESLLRRMVKSPRLHSKSQINEYIDEAVAAQLIDFQWRDRLHNWRKARNHAEHDLFALHKETMTRQAYQDFGYQLVQGAPEFFTYLAERNAPKQMALETQDEFLVKLSRLVTLIQQGRPSPLTGKPLKAMRFDPTMNQFEILAMQLMMVLRDVRFYVPEDYRWSSSPIISKFSVDTFGHVPPGFHPSPHSKLKLQAGETLNQLIARFERMINQECGDVQPAQFLQERIADGLRLENGNFHAGIKLNPRAKV